MKKIQLVFGILCLVLPLSTLAIKPNYEQLQPDSTSEVIHHTYYSLQYSEENEQASWVFYCLTPEFITDLDRTEDYRPDPAVSTGSATLDDYKGSGYDRGHLCPAADMKLNEVSISETFFLSNMSPQNASFNRGIWAKLESMVRDWCFLHDTLYIATGPVFIDNLGSIGADSVTIPGYFYKAIIDGAKKKTIAFVLPNAKSSEELSSFVITVDSLETLTGIDFFAGLPDPLEKELESKADFPRWTVKEGVNSVANFTLNQPTIYPTITNDLINIQGASEPLKISVLNSLGKCMLNTELVSGKTTLDLSTLNSGFYLIRVEGATTKRYTRVVKE